MEHHPEQSIPLAALQRVVTASVLRHLAIPLDVLERHLTAEEIEQAREVARRLGES